MKRIITISFLSLLISQPGNSQANDSIFTEQIKATRGICKEINKTNSILEQMLDSDSDSLVLTQISNQAIAIENLNETQIQVLDSLVNRVNQVNNESSFWHDALVESVAAFLGLLGAIVVFYLGLKYDRQKERDKEIEKQNEKNKFLKESINSSKRSIRSQIEEIEDYIRNIENNPREIPYLNMLPINNLKRNMILMENEDHFHSYMDQVGNSSDDVKNYSNIIGSLDYFYNQFNQIFKTQPDHLKFDHDRKIQYGQLSKIAIDRCTELGKSNEESNPALFHSIGQILSHYGQNFNTYDYGTVQEFCVEPMRKMLVDDFLEIKEVRIISSLLQEATFVYNEIPVHNLHHAKTYKELLEVANFTEKNLSENSKKINEYDS